MLPVSAELLDLLPDPVCVVDADGVLLYASAAFERVLGYAREDVVGTRIFALIHPDDREATREQALLLMQGGGQRHFRNRYLHRRGHVVELLWSAQWLPEHGVRIGVAREISELRRIERDLEYRANHDALTGLANRRHLRDVLDRALADCALDGTPATVLYLDLDGFKAINDRHGHEAGDRVLVETAQRLQHGLRQGDVVARVGGDEFVALLRACDPASAESVIDALRVRLDAPITIAGGLLPVHASIGIASAPADGIDADALLARADRAMYAAKRLRRGSVRAVPR